MGSNTPAENDYAGWEAWLRERQRWPVYGTLTADQQRRYQDAISLMHDLARTGRR